VAYAESGERCQQKTGNRGKVFTRGGEKVTRSDYWAAESNVDRVVNGIPNRMDRLKGIGNAIVPQIAQWIGYRILDYIKES
jgi:site-specific DNA-cytosine methylase